MASRFVPIPFNKVKRYKSARFAIAAQNFELALNEELKPSRELALAFTTLEEAVMWANRAIAVEGV
jgi:hypothetical protein